MSIYFSPSSMAFYDDAIHGQRWILITDECELAAELKALTEREDPLLDAPEGEGPDERQAREDALAGIADSRSALVANPPVMSTANPECRLPEDAVMISDDDHRRLIDGQAEGLVICWSDTAQRPVLGERPVDLGGLIAGVKKERDRLLRGSDWTQLPDNELDKATRAAWKAWRQDVREACRAYEAPTPGTEKPAFYEIFPAAPASEVAA